MSAHTPGAWDFCRVRGKWAVYAEIHRDDGIDRFLAEKIESKDDARLIAASHDLLSFAKAHDAYMLDAGYSGPDDTALHPKAAANWRACRAAIARATLPEREAGRG